MFVENLDDDDNKKPDGFQNVHGKHDVAHCVRGVTKRVTEANHAASNRLLKKSCYCDGATSHTTHARASCAANPSRERKWNVGKGKPAPPEASATEKRRTFGGSEQIGSFEESFAAPPTSSSTEH